MKNTILQDLFLSRELANLLGKMQPEHLRDDLKQELFLILLQTEERKIVSLHQSNQLRFYATRIVLNMIASSSSPFHKQYRQYLKQVKEEINDYLGSYSGEEAGYIDRMDMSQIEKTFLKHKDQFSADLNEAEEKEYRHSALVDAVNKCLGDLDDKENYESRLFLAYVEAGSAGKLIKQMKAYAGGRHIPKRTILQTVKNVKERIRKEVRVA
jgi:hypothetical protein